MSRYVAVQWLTGRVARQLGRGGRGLGLLSVIASAGCAGSADEIVTPTMPGAITLTTETSGFLKDDSYELLVDGASQGTIGANDEMTVTGLDPATYDVALGDVAENCVADPISIEVGSDETVDVSLSVVCAPPPSTPYTLRFTRARPNLDNGEIIDCLFGLCPTEEEWDMYVYYNSSTTPHSVIRQNRTTGAEISHLPGVSLAELTEADLASAAFTTELVGDPFDAGRVILIRTDLGAVYALGNPVEDVAAYTLTFDAVLIVNP